MKDRTELALKTCRPCSDGSSPLSDDAIAVHLRMLPEWSLENKAISRTYLFGNYYETMAFANALAWIAHAQNHHPEMEVGYKKCKVRFCTHSISGISENDFICAAKTDGLLAMAEPNPDP